MPRSCHKMVAKLDYIMSNWDEGLSIHEVPQFYEMPYYIRE